MKILHTADWHIGQFKGPVENGVNLRSLDTVKCLEFMVEEARKAKPDLVCVSGDIFHQEQIGPVRYSDEMVTATRIIETLSEYSKFVIVMRGTPNHDGGGQFKVLEKMLSHNKKIVVVTSPQVIQTPIADVACIPGFDKQEFRAKFPGISSEEENLVWTENISNMVMGLRSQCTNDVPAILMAHYTVPGCNMESGQISFFSNFEPVIPREALQAVRFEAVLLGHIHRPQSISGIDDVFYSGAINAMNFNDEGQSRGFWMHEFENGRLVRGTLIETPYRKFQTIKWDKDDIEAYLQKGQMALLERNIPFMIQDKIVRIQYSCTSEQKKALNVPLLQKELYDLGAFYVSDIEAENMVDVTNKGLMSEESDPLLNLKKWLNEKCFANVDKIVGLAEPIIAEAMKESPVAEIHGVFKPISISVKNYRNYKEEFFDFSDVSFCTINGVNGAGKSSLFMDAIVDCLFEETREGDSKAWIRGTEDARSGAIEFVFEIGNNRFRVVRTRMKSGRPTLNLSKMNGAGDWMNLSKERINDTQTEIEKILGMDSMTFRSCALIMQDQYGLFLQAKKDERIAILGNLLGLGIYGVMELGAKKHLGDAKRDLMSKKDAVKIKSDMIAERGNPEQELEDIERHINISTAEGEELQEQLNNAIKTVEAYKSAEENVVSLQKEIADCEEEKNKQKEIIEQNYDVISACDVILSKECQIRESAEAYEKAVADVQTLAEDKAKYEKQMALCSEYEIQITRYQNIIEDTLKENAKIFERINNLSKFNGQDVDISEKLKELENARGELNEMQQKKNRYNQLMQETLKKKAEVDAANNVVHTQIQLALSDQESCKRQKEYLENSGCSDLKNADCRFLRKAKEDVAKIKDIEHQIDVLREGMKEADKAIEEYMHDAGEKLHAIGYQPEEENRLYDSIKELSKYERLERAENERKAEIATLEALKEANDKTIASTDTTLSKVKLRALEITEMVETLSDSVDKYREISNEVERLKIYSEQEKQLPLYRERKENAVERMNAAKKVYDEMDVRVLEKTVKLFEATEVLNSMEKNSEEKIKELEHLINFNKDKIQNLNIKKGALLQKIEDTKKMREEIGVLKSEIAVCAELVTNYDILKQAFSQDGVPHQIIRNFIPNIEDTANNILGAMTGGTMGVEFVLERTVKGKDGDKATLDVMINEYGKTTLPYASKSGGEKVKASLAVILSLAEVKTTSAGIQLGMLFIDEPPFLDEDGTQAYVDSLETIRSRYPDVKIMAITHDDAMKARFTQSVAVVKTSDGSKVIY